MGEHYEKAKAEYESRVNAKKTTDCAPEIEPPTKPKSAFSLFSKEKRSEIMKELDTKDIAKVGKRIGEVWKSLAENEKQVYEDRVKAAMEDYEKAKVEYENRPEVKERTLKERTQVLKSEIGAAVREVAKATAHLEFLQTEFATAKKDLEEVKQQNKAATKKDTTSTKRLIKPTSSVPPSESKRARIQD